MPTLLEATARAMRRLTVRRRMLVILLGGAVLSLLAALLVSYSYSADIANTYINGYLRAEQRRAANSLELYVEEVILTSLRYKNAAEIYNIMQDETLPDAERAEGLRLAAQPLYPKQRSSLGNVYLVSKAGTLYTLANVHPSLPPPSLEFLQEIGNQPYSKVGETLYSPEAGAFIPIGMAYRNFYTGQFIGYLVMLLPQQAIHENIGGLLTTDGFTFLADTHGRILSHDDIGQLGFADSQLITPLPAGNSTVDEVTYSGARSLLISTSLSQSAYNIGFPWRIVSVIPYGEAYQVLQQVQRALLIVALVAAALAIAISLALSGQLTEPLRRLQGRMKRLAKGELDAYVQSRETDELWELEQGYNDMVARINDLIVKNREEQEKKREMEFIALQAQINPHFLYNTLDAIGWIAKIKKQEEIERMVLSLARFFRLSLHKGDKLISIEDELGITASYVEIEQLRNPGKFDVQFDVAEEIKGALVPKIILQPIVENAVKHGVSQVRRKGSIAIRGWAEAGDILLEVTDNGAGFDTAGVALVSGTLSNGYGIRNVDERIKLEYGPAYGLTVFSQPGEGTRVILRLRDTAD